MKAKKYEVVIIASLSILLACILAFIAIYMSTTIRAEAITTNIIAETCESISDATDGQPKGMQNVITTMNRVTAEGGDVVTALDAFVDMGIMQSYTIEPERIIAIMSDSTEWHYVLMDAIQGDN